MGCGEALRRHKQPGDSRQADSLCQVALSLDLNISGCTPDYEQSHQSHSVKSKFLDLGRLTLTWNPSVPASRPPRGDTCAGRARSLQCAWSGCNVRARAVCAARSCPAATSRPDVSSLAASAARTTVRKYRNKKQKILNHPTEDAARGGT